MVSKDFQRLYILNHFVINYIFSYRKGPIPEEELVTDEPSLKYFDHVPSMSSSPEDSDDEMLPPHLLTDSISQLEEFGKQNKWYRKHHRNQHRRQFNDLWVRLDDRFVVF